MSILQPLYHQPSDTEKYVDNKRRYSVFKKRLVDYLMKRQAEKTRREQNLTNTYSKIMADWLKKVDKVS